MIKYLNILLFCAVLAVNFLATILPINQMTTAEVSDLYPNLFVPAGITFAIWGVIYLLLAAFCIVQFRLDITDLIKKTGWPFAFTCLFNIVWILCWHYEKLPLSLMIMVALLITLIYLNIITADLPIGIIKATFGIYLGWICIATIANVTALLVYYNWNGAGLSEETWTIIMIFAGTIIASLSIVKFRNPFIGISIIWALLGIIFKRLQDYHSIVVVCIIAIILVTAFTIYGFLKKTSSSFST